MLHISLQPQTSGALYDGLTRECPKWPLNVGRSTGGQSIPSLCTDPAANKADRAYSKRKNPPLLTGIGFFRIHFDIAWAWAATVIGLIYPGKVYVNTFSNTRWNIDVVCELSIHIKTQRALRSPQFSLHDCAPAKFTRGKIRWNGDVRASNEKSQGLERALCRCPKAMHLHPG